MAVAFFDVSACPCRFNKSWLSPQPPRERAGRCSARGFKVNSTKGDPTCAQHMAQSRARAAFCSQGVCDKDILNPAHSSQCLGGSLGLICPLVTSGLAELTIPRHHSMVPSLHCPPSTRVVRDLEMGEDPGLSRWVQYHPKGPYKGTREAGEPEA